MSDLLTSWLLLDDLDNEDEIANLKKKNRELEEQKKKLEDHAIDKPRKYTVDYDLLDKQYPVYRYDPR